MGDASGPNTAGEPSDEELLTRVRSGDESAFAALVTRHQGWLVRLARTRVPSQAVAEEVAQETWLALLTGLDRFEGRSSLRTWLARVAINQAITRGTRERRSVPFSALEGAGEESSGPTVDADRFGPDGGWTTPPGPLRLPADRAEDGELREHLRAALAELPERQRLVVALRDVEGWTGEEVAQALDLSPENQRVLLHRGRARLQAALAPYLEGTAA